MTVLYIGGDFRKTSSEIYQNFVPGQEVQIEIGAVVYVEGCILTAICFPQVEIDNKCPHVTLMTSSWEPRMSNLALETTCLPGGVFHDLY